MRHVAYENGCRSDDEFYTMLQYFHDVGVVLFFGKDAKSTMTLSNMVVLHPQWLIDAFRQVVTADKKQIQLQHRASFEDFEEKGLLNRDLLDFIWKRSFDSEERVFLLDLMEKFDLLCAKRNLLPGSRSFIANNRVDAYFVPLRLRAKSSDLRPKHHLHKTSFFLDFHGFLPEGLFHRLLTRVIKWAQERGDAEPQIRFHQVRLRGNKSPKGPQGFSFFTLSYLLICPSIHLLVYLSVWIELLIHLNRWMIDFQQ